VVALCSVIAALALVMLTAGCSRRSAVMNNEQVVDINGAAEQAQGDIDTYLANALQTRREAAAKLAPALRPGSMPSTAPLTPPAPGTPGGLPDDRTPVSEAPFAPDSAQGAANVVQTYFGLIEAGQYGQARGLWGDGGQASGVTPAAFRRSFAKFAEYHANVGAPGSIDAGAGQRHVAVPVQVYGRLKDGGRPFALRGDVSLHRSADVDGATPDQKQWRIAAIDLEPAGAAPADSGTDSATPATAAADYHCDDGTGFHVAFDNQAGTGAVSVDGKQIAMLHAQRTGSGIWYLGGGYELRGKGDSAQFIRPGAAAVTCTAG